MSGFGFFLFFVLFLFFLGGVIPGFIGAYFLRENHAKENEKREKKVKHENQRKSRKKLFAFKSLHEQLVCVSEALNAKPFFVLFAEFS